MSELYFDHRWCAPHGIGRFATEVRQRLVGFADLPIGGSPTSPIDACTLARWLGRSGAKTFFTPGFNVPAWSKCNIVTTVHDLIHVHFRDEASVLKTAYYRYVQRPVIRRSPVTLTVSEFSRQQIIQWYGVDEDRVVVVGNGVSEDFTAEGPAAANDRPYFFYVGNAKPHKNVNALLHAFSMLSRTEDVALKLVMKPNDDLLGRVADLSIANRVEFLTGLSDSQLAALYRGASALVLPSYFEGFGLPIVEAMACGCPVIGANRTSIPEVAGKAGLLFEPDDHEQLADAMKRMLGESQERDTLVAHGTERAKEFQWAHVASKVQAALDPLIH